MIYDPISSVESVKPKEFPLYATDTYRAGGANLKFQKRQHAKAALRNKMRERPSYYAASIADISVYKYNFDTELYEKIFDSESELAQAFVKGVLTGSEMIDMIDW